MVFSPPDANSLGVVQKSLPNHVAYIDRKLQRSVSACSAVRDPVEAIRLRASRLRVWKKGMLLAETAEVVAKLRMNGRPGAVAFSQA